MGKFRYCYIFNVLRCCGSGFGGVDVNSLLATLDVRNSAHPTRFGISDCLLTLFIRQVGNDAGDRWLDDFITNKIT